MKPSPLLFALLTLTTALPVFAQQAAVPGQPLLPGSTLSAPAAAEAGNNLKRFDLDFRGGWPEMLVAAISKALGKPLNAIIPDEQKHTVIMPIKVVGVTVPELFGALETATSTERPMITNGGGGSQNVTFRNMAMGFRPNLNGTFGIITDATVWSFYSMAPPAEFLTGDKQASEQVCQYFQLAPYLDDHTIEDITTALQTGWKMLRIPFLPQLSFHAETKLLIAVGPAKQIEQIPQVLQQLQQDNTAAVDKIVKWQAELATIEGKKEPGGEKKAQELRERIESLAARQRARETMRSGRRAVPTLQQPQ